MQLLGRLGPVTDDLIGWYNNYPLIQMIDHVHNYAEGGATEAYNRAVCPSVCLLQAFLVAR